MDTPVIPDKLPVSLYKFFWDIEAAQLNPANHPTYVINRLLDKGDLEAARWVVKNFPKNEIVRTFKTVRDFSPWNGTFWANYLEIKEEEVACLQPSYRALRKQLWPY